MSQLTLLGLDWHSSATLRKEEEGKTSNPRVVEDMNPSVWREPASSLLYARGGGGGGMQHYYIGSTVKLAGTTGSINSKCTCPLLHFKVRLLLYKCFNGVWHPLKCCSFH